MNAGARRVFTLNLREETRARVAAHGFRYFDRLDLPPGRHEVRLMVHQPNGRTGSVVTHVEVPRSGEGPLAMSGIVLGSREAAADRILLDDAVLKRVFPDGPTARRRFAAGDALTAFVEVYPEARTAPDAVRLTATLARGNTRVTTVSGQLVADTPGRPGYTVGIPLQGLARGAFVLTLEARANRRTVSRSVPFTIE